MPLNVNDVGYDYEAAVAVTAPLCLQQEKDCTIWIQER
jgi:hypothetical protein